MFSFTKVSRSAIALTVVAMVGSCTGDDLNEALGPQLTGANAIFQNYVSIGNSITAGFQSGGINNAGQRQSYAFLLAQQMGTRFAYPALFFTGCPAPWTNFVTRTGPAGAPACALRDPASATDIMNNVAVPNASSFDPTSAATAFTNTLTSLFLSGKTQVQKALQADPTFLSIWIGNNDVLGFAVQDGRAAAPTGLAGMTTTAAFTANYDAMIAQILAGAPSVKGVLVGVVQVANAPIMFQGSNFSTPAFKSSFDGIACGGTPNSCAATGGVTLVDPSCTTAPGAGQTDYRTSLVNTFLAHTIRAGLHPSIVSCRPGGSAGTFPAPVGDILILDPAEQVTVQKRIDEYNAKISAKANEIGFAYVDPNPLLVALKGGTGPIILTAPNYGTVAAPPAAPFGTGMSLDGVHPAAAVQRAIANALIPAINTKFGTTLSLVP